MVNEQLEKQKLIKEINRCLEEIEYWRKNYVFEEELEYEDIKEIDFLLGQLWHKYYKLYKSKCEE
jgi:hypothetical protein